MAKEVARLLWPTQLFVSQEVKIAEVGTIPERARMTAPYRTDHEKKRTVFKVRVRFFGLRRCKTLTRMAENKNQFTPCPWCDGKYGESDKGHNRHKDDERSSDVDSI